MKKKIELFVYRYHNLKYPQNPQALGEKIRKARMDKGLMIKELALQLGVTEDTVINWEIRNIKPEGINLERVMDFIKRNHI